WRELDKRDPIAAHSTNPIPAWEQTRVEQDRRRRDKRNQIEDEHRSHKVGRGESATVIAGLGDGGGRGTASVSREPAGNKERARRKGKEAEAD
ncbi:hypothetical protein GW17_00047736, partial [Ensete ventricosum]